MFWAITEGGSTPNPAISASSTRTWQGNGLVAWASLPWTTRGSQGWGPLGPLAGNAPGKLLRQPLVQGRRADKEREYSTRTRART